MLTPHTPPSTPTLLEIATTSQLTSSEEFLKTISNVDPVKDFLEKSIEQAKTKKKQLQEYFEKTKTIYQLTEEQTVQISELQKRTSIIEKDLLLLQQPINSPQTSSDYLPPKDTITSQRQSLSKLQTSTREAIQDLIKENLALKSVMRTQQESISELHTWVSGLLFGGIGCSTTAALMFWLWHYTHK